MGIKSRKAPGLLFLDSSISPTTTMTWLSRVQGGAAVLGLARSPRCTEPLAPIPARPSGGLLQLLWFPAQSLWPCSRLAPTQLPDIITQCF